MAAQRAGPLWTIGQYLDMERHSTVKHAYHDGYVSAVAGGTQDHSQIAGNVYALLRAGVRSTGCRALNPDIKIRQSPDDDVYADAVVTCDPRDDAPRRDWIDYPTLVVEVLSPSTERYDQGDKFDDDKAIPTFREYVLVEYRRREVEVRRRDDSSGAWNATTYGPGAAVPLTSVALTLPMDLIYEDSSV